MPTRYEPNWYIERGIPLTLIVTLFINIIVGVWFAAKMDSRIAAVEAWTKDNAGIERRLTAVEVLLQANRDAVLLNRGVLSERLKGSPQ